ncbi:MAG: SGNH/GDSL hydrolase family protein [Armatimonadota bacterium]|nr:SGNH/GDSL hydrolase family protein [Armatimonadota bacterium]
MKENMKEKPLRRSGFRVVLLRLLLAVFSLLLMLGLVELSFWMFGINPLHRATGWGPHPIWHRWHEPNVQDEFQFPGIGLHTVRFNEHGMRDSRSIAVAKPPGTFRIALIGDSFIEAQQVTEPETIARQLENRLQPAIQRSWKQRLEVLNFGCSAIGTGPELLLLREFALQFDPDVVILCYYFNDVTEDSQIAHFARYEGKELVSLGNPGYRKKMRKRKIRAFLRNSRFYRFAEGAIQAGRQRRHFHDNTGQSLLANEDAIVHDPYTAEDEKAWNYSLPFLGQMADLLKQR